MSDILAAVANERVAVLLRAASPVTLHSEEFWRADGNSPVVAKRDGVDVFFSDYQPSGRTFRRHSDRPRIVEGKSDLVRLIDDPDPRVGKWIEAVWRDPAGGMRGWYHAEEVAPCPAKRLFVPHIGEMISHDEGSSWQCRGEVLRVSPAEIDCSWRNGFFAGGYGDLSVVPDGANDYLYLAFTSYRLDETKQGVVIGRMPAKRPPSAALGLQLWSDDGWQNAAAGCSAKPLWRARRGWRHPDPDNFWGPALHYNQNLDCHVMLLNRTAGGAGDLVQEGIYISMNEALDDPEGWSEPQQLVRGGAWYPQIVGFEPGQGDSKAGSVARFFMGGFSAWEIEFLTPSPTRTVARPLRPTRADFTGFFGPHRRCPW
jgi:hypothetical protein